MRIITVKAPTGFGTNIAETAFEAGATQVTVRQEMQLTSEKKEVHLDVVEVDTATPKGKKFIESLMEAPFYNSDTFSFTIRHPESLFAKEPPEKETHPIVRPSTDVYQELWQFTKITYSLVLRVFLSSLLLAYGMVDNMLPLIIAGLLFLPYHHHMLGVGLGAVLREWNFLKQGLLALIVSTVTITLAGAFVALFAEAPVQFNQFSTPLSGMLLSLVIGMAAAFGAIDDAGRRELVGLAATAHISVYPAWFGLKLVYGFNASDHWQEHLLTFCINVTALTLAAGITFIITGMKGKGIRRFVSSKTGEA
ncbi:MAG: hypothetical protein LPK19_01745 [Hymenobacteraceae bacterium]|nr:hypothetical protein [Hymenobacteraceae bacterium]MDX5394897.1 hypothetical protein [Hymenobacteraceae bacterium]MDX5510933.1 hypothetical protein [Hymenobacteraceae bacterium]